MTKNDFLTCISCGKEFPAVQAAEARTMEKGTRYVCPKCMAKRGHTHGGVWHRPAKHGVSYRAQIQTGSAIPAEFRNAEYNLRIENGDITSPIYKNLSGVKASLRSWQEWLPATEWETLRLTAYIAGSADMVQILHHVPSSRFFERLNVKIDHGKVYLSGETPIRNVSLTFHAANLLGELVTIANKWAENGKIAGGIKKMSAIVSKYEAGRADCQRPERNSR